VKRRSLLRYAALCRSDRPCSRSHDGTLVPLSIAYIVRRASPVNGLSAGIKFVMAAADVS
jgi:hypothetical protein